MSNLPPVHISASMQQAIQKANDANIELLLTAARTNDPLAPALLGISKEALAEFVNISKSDLLSPGRIGAPLFTLRISDPAQLRAVVRTGFSSASVLAELTKNWHLEHITKGGANESDRS